MTWFQSLDRNRLIFCVMFNRKQIWSLDGQIRFLCSRRPLSHRCLSSSGFYPILTNKGGPGFKFQSGMTEQLSGLSITEVRSSNPTEVVVQFFSETHFSQSHLHTTAGPEQNPLKNRSTTTFLRAQLDLNVFLPARVRAFFVISVLHNGLQTKRYVPPSEGKSCTYIP